MSYYERRLPHWHPDQAAVFVMWRLHGSLPRSAWEDLPEMPAGRAFVTVDRELATAATGPTWLNDERVAQDESYDRWVRDPKEFGKIAQYIEFNPVAAGLVQRPEEWPWSSAHMGAEQEKKAGQEARPTESEYAR